MGRQPSQEGCAGRSQVQRREKQWLHRLQTVLPSPAQLVEEKSRFSFPRWVNCTVTFAHLHGFSEGRVRSLKSLILPGKKKSQHNNNQGRQVSLAWREPQPGQRRGNAVQDTRRKVPAQPHGISIGGLHRQSITALLWPWGPPVSQAVVSTSGRLLLRVQSQAHRDVEPAFPLSASDPKAGRGGSFSCLLGMWDESFTTGADSENRPFFHGLGIFFSF